jgi:hypothetical protein
MKKCEGSIKIDFKVNPSNQEEIIVDNVAVNIDFNKPNTAVFKFVNGVMCDIEKNPIVNHTYGMYKKPKYDGKEE